MFTIEQIKAAHAKVKSGADFSNYIKELKALGVTGYETWVADGHTEYFGDNNYKEQSQPMYPNLGITYNSDLPKFAHYLKIHQEGKTNYLSFCHHCAETGIEKWIVSLEAMTCTYFDKSGKKVLVEKIPQ
jgi:uncharacterized protein YbcV (DUF1398 family)